MADNIPITAGSGTTIATDNIAGVNYQRIKLDNGADGVVGGDVCSTNPLPVINNSGNSVIGAVSSQPVRVSGSFNRPATTPTFANGNIAANSATAGSVVPVTIAAARANDLTGRITGVRLTNSSAVITNAVFRVHFFSSSPGVVNGDGANAFVPSVIAPWLGWYDVTINEIASNGSMGVGICGNGTPFLNFTPDTGTQNVYCLLEVKAAYVGVGSQTFTIYVDTE